MEDFLKLQPLEILQRAVPLRDYFASQKIGPASIVGVAQGSALDAVACLFGLWSLGATTWLCPLREPAAKLDLLSRHIGAELLLGTPNLRLGSLNQAEQLLADMMGARAKTLINTSGSTGLPKFVEHELSQHFLSAQGVNEAMQFDKDSNWLLSLPIYHVGGLAIVIRAVAASASITVPEPGQRVEDVVLNESVTHMSLVAAQLRKWIDKPELLQKMKQATRVILGGGPVPSWLSEVSRQNHLPVVASYGATEMASMWTAGQGKGSGKVLPSRELKISSEGEILVRGPMLFRRYLAHEGSPFDAEGFYRSSDLGHLDDEKNLIILGRKDNMFISGGENIHPQEIELSLLNHPRVEAAHVVAVPDDKWGKRPVAYVRMVGEDQISDLDLRTHLKKSLPSFKIPDQFLSWRTDIRQKADALAQA